MVDLRCINSDFSFVSDPQETSLVEADYTEWKGTDILFTLRIYLDTDLLFWVSA